MYDFFGFSIPKAYCLSFSEFISVKMFLFSIPSQRDLESFLIALCGRDYDIISIIDCCNK